MSTFDEERNRIVLDLVDTQTFLSAEGDLAKHLELELYRMVDIAMRLFNDYSDIGKIVLWKGYPQETTCFYYQLPRLGEHGSRERNVTYIPVDKTILHYVLLHGVIWRIDKKVVFGIPDMYLDMILDHPERAVYSIPEVSMKEIMKAARAE